MITDMALKLATKDFLSGGVLHWHILQIREVPKPPEFKPKGGGGVYVEREKRKYIEITFQYKDEIYKETKYIDKDVEVTAEMVSIEIKDNHPTVIITL